MLLFGRLCEGAVEVEYLLEAIREALVKLLFDPGKIGEGFFFVPDVPLEFVEQVAYDIDGRIDR